MQTTKGKHVLERMQVAVDVGNAEQTHAPSVVLLRQIARVLAVARIVEPATTVRHHAPSASSWR